MTWSWSGRAWIRSGPPPGARCCSCSDCWPATELPADRALGLVAHRTPEGDAIPNLGVLAVRSTPKARAFLQEVSAQTRYLHHTWWENAAVLAVLGYTTEAPVVLQAPTPHLALVHFLDPGWNSLSTAPAAHPRIVHFAGQSQAVRLEGLRRLSGA
jgi:hypothetical protein